MAGSILGNRVPRTEDPELLTVGGVYCADLELDNPLHVVLVRSPYAHAELNSVDIAEAESAPGVVAVYTADTLGVAPHHGFVPVHDDFLRSPLATDRVRFVGEAVAAVVAESYAEAVDAAELVFADYNPLPAVTDAEDALADGAPLLFPEHGNNIAVSGHDDANPDLFAEAAHVVRGRYVNSRMAGAPIEPNSCVAVPGDDGRTTFYVATQMPHLLHMQMANALGVEKSDIRVIAPHVGGGFGAKAGLYHEHTLTVAVARMLNRPVTFTESRSENMVALAHSRSQVQYAELGVREDGTFCGLRVHLVGDSGGYPGIGSMLPAGTKRMSNATYAFPAIEFDLLVAATNTTPTGAFRGAGRPEATAMVERLVDQAAIETGIDPIEIRKRNFLANDVFPFDTLTGVTYDCGNYELPLDRVVELADYAGLRAEQAARRESGDKVQLGIGIASYVEVTAGGGSSEYGAIEVHPDGSATVKAGTSAHGQGHQTTFAMIVSDKTGIPVENIKLVQSDTDLVRTGGGTGGSRSLQLGGSAVANATDAMIVKAKSLAAHLLEASAEDIVIEDGKVGVAGVPARALGWGDLAAAATDAPDGVVDQTDETVGLAAQLDFDQGAATFPFGAHIAVAEVDTETGEARVIRHVAVDDAGTVVSPTIFEGQQHGGIATGLSQVLYEEVRYDDDGNPVTSNLAEYLLPAASDMPSFEAHYTETPTPLNPLGAKGIGEASTIGSTPAIQNAIIDAVSHLGIRHIDMPCSPQRMWEHISAATAGTPIEPWSEPPAAFASLGAERELTEDEIAAAEGI